MPEAMNCVRNSHLQKNRLVTCVLALTVLLLCADPSSGQQAQVKKNTSRPAAAIDPRLEEAQELLSQGRVEEAKQKIQEQLQQNPKSVEGYNMLGILYTGQKDYENALDAFQHALKLNPNSVRTRINLGNIYIAQENLGSAEKEFRETLRIEPSNSDGNYNLGLVLLARNNPSEAIQHFLLVKPATTESRFNLTRAYLRAGRSAQGLKVAADLSAQNPKPDSPEILYLLAQVYADQARAVDALELLVRAHKLAPENTDIIFLLARVSMTQNYFEDAIPLLESGIKIAPRRADLHAALGESFFMSGKADKAINEFKQLIDLDPAARSYAFMGLSYRHLGRFDEARKYFQDGLAQDPHNASCLFNMGYIEERQGNHARAEELFQQALRSNPDFSEALLELANLRIANKRLQEAADLLRRYVKVSRSAASGYYKLAMVERSLHQMEAAQRDLNVFQTLSKDSSPGPYPYQHLFDYLDN